MYFCLHHAFAKFLSILKHFCGIAVQFLTFFQFFRGQKYNWQDVIHMVICAIKFFFFYSKRNLYGYQRSKTQNMYNLTLTFPIKEVNINNFFTMSLQLPKQYTNQKLNSEIMYQERLFHAVQAAVRLPRGSDRKGFTTTNFLIPRRFFFL